MKENHLNLFMCILIEGIPSGNATKVWIAKSGKCLLCNNNSRIQERILRNMMDIIEARSHEIIRMLSSNAGGLWDNAKKYIESGHFGGKGSDAHKAAVIEK